VSRESRSWPGRLIHAGAWLAWLGLTGTAAVLARQHGEALDDSLGYTFVAVAVCTFAVLALTRRRMHARAWIFIALALLLDTYIASEVYVLGALSAAGRSLPAVEAVALVNFASLPAFVLLLPFLFVGKGRRRWPYVFGLASAASLAALLLLPGPLAAYPTLENPIGVEALGDHRASIELAWLAVACATALVGVASFMRTRRTAKAGIAHGVLPRLTEQESRANEETGPSDLSLVARLVERRRERRKASPWRFLGDLPRTLPYLRPYWKLGVVAVSMIGLTTLVSLLTPWPLAILIDAVLDNKPLPSLLGPLADLDRNTLLVIAVVSGLLVTAAEHGLGVINQYVNTKLEQRMVLDFRSDLFKHAQGLSIAFHDKARTGGLMYQLNNQASAMGAITVSIPPLAQAFFTLVGMFAIAYRIDPQLALLSLTVVPVIYYSAGYYARRIEPKLMNVRSLEGQSLVLVHEAVSMLKVIVAFGRENHEHKRFREQGRSAVDARIAVTVRQTLFSLAISVTTALGTALVLGFGAYHVLQRQLTPGELLIVMGYIAAIYAPLEQISVTFSSLQEQFISLQGALELLDTEPEVSESPEPVELARARGRIEFDGVSFRYRRRRDALRNISFVAEAGQQIAVVGPTGAGKTTLVSLIPRFYDPRKGRVLLDGVDIRDVKLKSLRDQVSIVLQEPLLFSGTILENIRYGRLDANEDEVVEAARAAKAHDFVSALPQGYETEIGERGAQLSVGERQRISIARAFLKDAPILILDEPTASIDSRTESVILEALERLMAGRTTILIAHRLSTIRGADLILVINDGRLVERGSHEELIARGGLYSQLCEFQSALAERGRELRMATPKPLVRRASTPFPTRVGELIGGTDAISGELPDVQNPLAEVARLESLARESSERAGRDGEPDGAVSVPDSPEQPHVVASSDSSLENLVDEAIERARHPDDAVDSPGEDGAEGAWLLVGAVRALLDEASQAPLVELAARRNDTLRDVRAAARLADSLLRDLGFHEEADEARRAGRKADVSHDKHQAEPTR
jgi:ATP-binding cassette, subfamily B, bacterial